MLRRGWAGDVPRPQPSFDAVLVLVETPLDPVARDGLVVNTGLGRVETLTAEATEAQLGLALPPPWQVYRLSAPGGTLSGARAWRPCGANCAGSGPCSCPRSSPWPWRACRHRPSASP